MGNFFIEAETERITFPDGQWVDVKQELSQADSDYILNKMANASQNGGGAKVEVQLGRLPLLERSIVAWSFKDGDKPVPVTTENISKLRVKYRTVILKKVDTLNAAAQEFSKNS